MTRNIAIAQAERRLCIAEWITSIYSIFWSVWWGFFADKILKNEGAIVIIKPFISPTEKIIIPKNICVLSNIIIVSLFAWSYVHWLWDAQKTAFKTYYLRDFLRNSIPLGFSMIMLCSYVRIIGAGGGFPSPLIKYGIYLTGVWPIVVLFALWHK